MSTPVFGDPQWIRKAGHYQELPLDYRITIDDALNAGYCSRSEVEDFADRYFSNWRRRGGATVAEVAALLEEYPDVDRVLQFIRVRLTCRFCNRIGHTAWCKEREDLGGTRHGDRQGHS